MTARQKVFVDTGGWLALVLSNDAYHPRAAEAWNALQRSGSQVWTSVPVVIETFTYLQRKIDARLAETWSAGLRGSAAPRVVECSGAVLQEAWAWMARKEFHKLSLVDATSFVILQKEKTKQVLGFDTHFAQAGFRLIA